MRDLAIVPGATIAVMVLNVLMSFGVVWVYSTFINPGHPASVYEAFALETAPVSSVVAGIPLMIAAGYHITRGRQKREALVLATLVAVLYVLVDFAILATVGVSAVMWAWATLSYITKIVAAIGGGVLQLRHAAKRQ